MSRGLRWAAAGAAVAAVAVMAVVYYQCDPAAMPFPRCLFRTLTGLECPGCGSQRALHALLHGRTAEAIALNPLLAVALPVMGAAIVAEWAPDRFPRLHAIISSRGFIIIIITCIITWTIYRNL